jgi:hypothetical protein
MDVETQKEEFSFGWLALKLLGKSLYSNAWSAISELAANGFDAGATKVYVYIDITRKSNAIVEIFDDGLGMDGDGIKTYVKVGFNKRLALTKTTSDDYLIMGRKGIGKLAALYLSESYYLITKNGSRETKWQMEYKENSNKEDEKPFLSEITRDVNVACKAQWSLCKTGTLLRMNNVNLAGLGDAAFCSLERKLANFFALDAMGGKEILLCVKNDGGNDISFQAVKKKIAFKNMAFIGYNAKETNSKISEIVEANKNNIIWFPYTKLNGTQHYPHTVKIEDFNDIEQEVKTRGIIECQTIDGRTVSKEYMLKGWIGVHSSIDEKQAQERDGDFFRNKFYNPIQLRLYVRNKLAVENFLNVINSTQTFVNYIEGEIHFDILDDDDLPDIATSNRQNLDEHSERVQLLISIVKKIVNHLISKRTNLTKDINAKEDELKGKQDATAKKQFADEVEDELNNVKKLTLNEKSSLTAVISNKIKGDIEPKSDYIIFLSHSSKDKIITDFIYQLLKFRGASDSEFFYTSRDDVDQYDNTDSLSTQIKKNLINESALLTYLTSEAYKSSEFCMFEGGAGWATRSVGEYIVLSLTYDEIPKFITNGKLEFCIEKDERIDLDRHAYLFVIKMLNRMIEHLNAGRRLNNKNEIMLFPQPDIPSDIQLSQDHKTIKDYMDKDIVKYWDFYINKNLKTYLYERQKMKSQTKKNGIN